MKKGFGNFKVNLVAAPDFFPNMTLVPSVTNATQFSRSHSSLKPALVEQTLYNAICFLIVQFNKLKEYEFRAFFFLD